MTEHQDPVGTARLEVTLDARSRELLELIARARCCSLAAVVRAAIRREAKAAGLLGEPRDGATVP